MQQPKTAYNLTQYNKTKRNQHNLKYYFLKFTVSIIYIFTWLNSTEDALS